MASARTVARLDALVWALIFGGLLVLVLGVATARSGAAASGWSLLVLGGLAAATGVVLIFVRARLRTPAPAGAESNKEK